MPDGPTRLVACGHDQCDMWCVWPRDWPRCAWRHSGRLGCRVSAVTTGLGSRDRSDDDVSSEIFVTCVTARSSEHRTRVCRSGRLYDFCVQLYGFDSTTVDSSGSIERTVVRRSVRVAPAGSRARRGSVPTPARASSLGAVRLVSLCRSHVARVLRRHVRPPKLRRKQQPTLRLGCPALRRGATALCRG